MMHLLEIRCSYYYFVPAVPEGPMTVTDELPRQQRRRRRVHDARLDPARVLGTDEIILIHHTDCGMLTFSDDDVKARIHEDTGIRPTFALEAFADLDDDIC